MRIIKLVFEFSAFGPIWAVDDEGILNEDIDNDLNVITGIKCIDDNKEVQALNKELNKMYSSYYEFDSHDSPCWFNSEKQKEEKEKVLNKLNRLKELLNEVNDGSFEIVDEITPIYENL